MPQRTDEFGGYSKAWLADDCKKDIDSISSLLGLDIDQKAMELVSGQKELANKSLKKESQMRKASSVVRTLDFKNSEFISSRHNDIVANYDLNC